jgi:arabinose-5-phosphate isomerase
MKDYYLCPLKIQRFLAVNTETTFALHLSCCTNKSINQQRIFMIDHLKLILQQEAAAVLNIPVTASYEKAVDLIIEQIHHKKGKLVTSGMGKAGQIASNIATTFSSTGTTAVFLHPSEAQHGDLGVISENDLLLVISNSGKTREIIELIGLSKILVPGIRCIVITGNENSPLAEQADIVLFTGNPQEVCPLGLTPTTSTTAMTVIGDMLVVSVMKKTGFSKEEYAKRHHGGYLGAVSRGNESY